jgi:hypothetical protein
MENQILIIKISFNLRQESVDCTQFDYKKQYLPYYFNISVTFSIQLPDGYNLIKYAKCSKISTNGCNIDDQFY